MASKIKLLFNRLRNSNDGKTVASNFGYLMFLQIAGYVFPLITMPYLARTIGSDGFGKIAFAGAIIGWIQTISDWGFNLTATRDVAQNRDDKEKVSEIFSNVLWARCLLTVVSGLILTLVTFCVPYFRENALIIFVTYLLVPGHILFPEWFFQAIEKMKYTTFFNLALKFIFTIAVFVIIKDKDDFIYQPLLTTIGYILCGVVALYLILGKWGYNLKKPNWHSIICTIKNSTDVFINNLMPNLYNSLSVILLGVFGGSVANGIFDGGNKFVDIFNKLLQILTRAFYPFLSRRMDKHSLYAKINIGSSILAASVLFIFAPLIVKIMLGPEFVESILVMRIMSVSLVFLAICNTYGMSYLIIHHHEKPLRNITLVASIIGMLLAVPLVKYYTYIGAVLVILISRGLLGGLSYWQARKYMKIDNKHSL